MSRPIAQGSSAPMKVIDLLSTANFALMKNPPDLKQCIAALEEALQDSGSDPEVNAALQFVWGNYLESSGKFGPAMSKFELAKEWHPQIWGNDADKAIQRCAEKEQQQQQQQSKK